MWTTLAIYLCLGISIHTEDIGAISLPTSTNVAIDARILSSADLVPSSSSMVDIKEELTKIATTCLSSEDVERLAGNTFPSHVVGMFVHVLVEQSMKCIGLQELRAALHLPAPSPWKPLNRTEPSEQELQSATTLEQYYNLKEPRYKMISLDSEFLFERNVDTAITYLDKRLPSIRNVFRRKFEEICPSASEVLDRKAVDRMVEQYHKTYDSIYGAASKMLRRYECWDRLD